MNSQQPTAFLSSPATAFDAEGKLRSTTFDDIYFSRQDGPAETRHVFLQGNGLPERWRDAVRFTIGELGFGTGLNFMIAWQEFLRTNANGVLHYISVEKFPFRTEQLRQLHGNQPWIDAYPLRLPGWHRIHLERCVLTLGFGDAEELLHEIDAQVDAWFLDGFAPAKNEAMWRDSLLADITRLTANGGSFATFTAAGAVKRSLSAHGFNVRKVPGFGHKRDMLVGRHCCEGGNPARDAQSNKGSIHSSAEMALVIGAGIAGATTARALAERGWQVTVLEAASIASGASGNPAGALYPQLTKHYLPATAWHATGYALMLRQLAHWRAAGLIFRGEQLGMLRILPRAGDAQNLLQSLQLDADIARYVSPAEASILAGMEVSSDGIYLPQGSWIAPAELCRALLQHPNITLREHCAAMRITRAAGSMWEVHAAQEMLRTRQLILCNADAAQALLSVPLPMSRSAGQISMVAAPPVMPRCIVSHRGYIIPAGDTCLIGATYDRDDLSGAITDANHAENLQHAREALGSWADGLQLRGGRTSFRATTPDRLPYVGRVEAGLYVSLGHGSRGMISAPLAAEVIAAQLNDEMVPLTPELLRATDPLRRAR